MGFSDFVEAASPFGTLRCHMQPLFLDVLPTLPFVCQHPTDVLVTVNFFFNLPFRVSHQKHYQHSYQYS